VRLPEAQHEVAEEPARAPLVGYRGRLTSDRSIRRSDSGSEAIRHSIDSTTTRHCGFDIMTLSAPSLDFISEGIRTLSCGYSLTRSPGPRPAGGRPPRGRFLGSARRMRTELTEPVPMGCLCYHNMAL
jgi:hypothetical protein